MQKIVRVREGEPIRELDELTETWTVVRIMGPAERQEGQDEWVKWVYVLLERDEKASGEKLLRHQDYLNKVSRLRVV